MRTDQEQLEIYRQIAKETWRSPETFVLHLGKFGHFWYPGHKGRKFTDEDHPHFGKCLGGITDPGGRIYFWR